MPKRYSVLLGKELDASVNDISKAGDKASSNGYDCIVSYVVRPQAIEEKFQGDLRSTELWRENPVFERNDVILQNLEDTEYAIGLAYDGDLSDIDRELSLRQQLAFSAYLGIGSIIFKCPESNIADYARLMNSLLKATGHVLLNLDVKVVEIGNIDAPPSIRDVDLMKSWRTWNDIRIACNYNSRLALALEMPRFLPPLSHLSHWFAEPVRYVIIPVEVFRPNQAKWPVLPKAQQLFLLRLIKRSSMSMTVIVRGSDSAGLPEKWTPDTFSDYLRHLIDNIDQNDGLRALNDPSEIVDVHAAGYEDYLQAPLQPLMDNLDSGTYEVFERDPVKYDQYEKAIEAALRDRPPGRVVMMVVGAGRGPLVTRCLRAAENVERQVTIYAVEKNANAIVTLQTKNQLDWDDRVKLVFSDMRKWSPPELADIMVSELLGSLGDNELSPECLDGAQRFLKSDGVSIPASYTAFVTPMQSPRIFAQVNLLGSYDNNLQKKGPDAVHETPYVVMLQAVEGLCFTEKKRDVEMSLYGPKRIKIVKECWKFEHPNAAIAMDAQNLPMTNYHNVRTAHLSFKASTEGVLHGFGGYFESVLYKDVEISTHPDTYCQKSGEMSSWFPLWFPIKVSRF